MELETKAIQAGYEPKNGDPRMIPGGLVSFPELPCARNREAHGKARRNRPETTGFHPLGIMWFDVSPGRDFPKATPNVADSYTSRFRAHALGEDGISRPNKGRPPRRHDIEPSWPNRRFLHQIRSCAFCFGPALRIRVFCQIPTWANASTSSLGSRKAMHNFESGADFAGFARAALRASVRPRVEPVALLGAVLRRSLRFPIFRLASLLPPSTSTQMRTAFDRKGDPLWAPFHADA